MAAHAVPAWASECASSAPSSAASPAGSGSTAKAKRLLEAAGRGDLEQVIALLDASSASVNSLRVRGCTALHEAAKGGHLPVVTELLRRSAEINAVNRSGCTPLHFACLCKDKQRALEVAEFLLDTNAAVNATGERMDTPLHFAAYCDSSPGCVDVIQCLISQQSEVNMRNRKSDTPLMNAAIHDNAEVVKVLLDYGADTAQQNSLSKTARDLATEKSCFTVLQIMDQHGDPISQLKDISLQMRSALAHVQSMEVVSTELKRQSARAEAFESLALTMVSELHRDSRAHLAEQTLQTLRRYERRQATASGALGPLEPAKLLQLLLTLLLIVRGAEGAALLHSLGILEVLPYVEQLVGKHKVGHKELKELRAALDASQVELLEMCAERSSSSSPSSTLDIPTRTAPSPISSSHRAHSCISTASSMTSCAEVASTGYRAPAPHYRSSPDLPEAACDPEGGAASRVGMQRHTLRFQHCRAHRPHWTSAPCVMSRGCRPLFADERHIVSEDESMEGSTIESSTSYMMDVLVTSPSLNRSQSDTFRIHGHKGNALQRAGLHNIVPSVITRRDASTETQADLLTDAQAEGEAKLAGDSAGGRPAKCCSLVHGNACVLS
uniref:Uncharacterized protein n=1 Tax=Pyrodinium bahamense TaxID=73915 RepID=A0A7S0FVW9_9DINO